MFYFFGEKSRAEEKGKKLRRDTTRDSHPHKDSRSPGFFFQDHLPIRESMYILQYHRTKRVTLKGETMDRRISLETKFEAIDLLTSVELVSWKHADTDDERIKVLLEVIKSLRPNPYLTSQEAQANGAPF
jgi:hypothetical protein